MLIRPNVLPEVIPDKAMAGGKPGSRVPADWQNKAQVMDTCGQPKGNYIYNDI